MPLVIYTVSGRIRLSFNREMKYLTKNELFNLKPKEMQKYVDNYSSRLLGTTQEIKSNIKNYFIKLLLDERFYSYSSIHLVSFFIDESHLFTHQEKETILNNVSQMFKFFCHSKNEMVSFILLDFIVKEIDENLVTIQHQTKRGK